MVKIHNASHELAELLCGPATFYFLYRLQQKCNLLKTFVLGTEGLIYILCIISFYYLFKDYQQDLRYSFHQRASVFKGQRREGVLHNCRSIPREPPIRFKHFHPFTIKQPLITGATTTCFFLTDLHDPHDSSAIKRSRINTTRSIGYVFFKR